MARYEEYKLGWFSTEVSNDSADGKIVSEFGGFSIILVLNFVNCTSGRPRLSYEEGPRKEEARKNQKSERRQGGRYLRKYIQEKEITKKSGRSHPRKTGLSK